MSVFNMKQQPAPILAWVKKKSVCGMFITSNMQVTLNPLIEPSTITQIISQNVKLFLKHKKIYLTWGENGSNIEHQ